jgi:excisionase family DNA binding protein
VIRRENKTERLRKRLFTITQAAEYLGRSSWAVRAMIWAGKLPAVRDGKRVLVDVHDMDRWIEVNKIQLND